MPTDIIMPQMGESIVEGTITKWLKKPGDKVQRDEPLFEISHRQGRCRKFPRQPQEFCRRSKSLRGQPSA